MRADRAQVDAFLAGDVAPDHVFGKVGVQGQAAAERGQGEKRQHFNIANAEAGEVAASVYSWLDDELVDANDGYHVIRLYGRVGAMMVGLIRKHDG